MKTQTPIEDPQSVPSPIEGAQPERGQRRTVQASGSTLQSAAATWTRLAISAVLLVAALLLLPQFKSDYVQSYAAARGWWDGRDPNAQTAALLADCCTSLARAYPDMQTAHPPFATLLALPLGRLPWLTAQLVWLLLSWAAILMAWQIGRIDPWSCAATTPFWIIALGLGTHEPLLFLLLALALRIDDGRRTTDRAGLVVPAVGVLLGLCAAIKVYPALLLLGLLLNKRRADAAIAAATGLATVLLSELVLGFGVTWGWLQWTPINTLRYVDEVGNNSLVRLVRELAPGLSPALIALVLLALLTLPLLPRLRQGNWLRPLVPVMLLVSPLSWRHYIGLATLIPLTRFEQGCIALSGVVALLIGMNLLPPDNLAVVVQLPLLLVLLLLWYRGTRPPRRHLSMHSA